MTAIADPINAHWGNLRKSLAALRKNCGTGAGGFQPGNTCGKEEGGGTATAEQAPTRGRQQYLAGMQPPKASGVERQRAEILKQARAIEFSNERYQPPSSSVSRTDYDGIEEVLTTDERRQMERAIERAQDEYMSDTSDYDFSNFYSNADVAREAGYGKDHIDTHIDEVLTDLAVAETETDAQNVRAVYDAVTPVGSGADRIENWLSKLEAEAERRGVTLPASVSETLNEYRAEAEHAIEEKREELEQSALEQYTESQLENFDSTEARRDWLRNFYDDNEDRFASDPDTAQQKKWLNTNTGRAFVFNTSDGRPFTIEADKHPRQGRDVHNIVFSDESGDTTITGKGKAFEVFSNVVPAVTSYVQHEKPEVMTFQAHDESRQKLYNRLVSTVLGTNEGYVAKYYDSAGWRNYFVARADVMPDLDKLAEERGYGAMQEIGVRRSLEQDPGKPEEREWHDIPAEVDPAWFTPEGWEDFEPEPESDKPADPVNKHWRKAIARVKSLASLRKNCGTGSGGFQPGNTCGKEDGGGSGEGEQGRGGSGKKNDARTWDKLPKFEPAAEVAEVAKKLGLNPDWRTAPNNWTSQRSVMGQIAIPPKHAGNVEIQFHELAHEYWVNKMSEQGKEAAARLADYVKNTYPKFGEGKVQNPSKDHVELPNGELINVSHGTRGNTAATRGEETFSQLFSLYHRGKLPTEGKLLEAMDMMMNDERFKLQPKGPSKESYVDSALANLKASSRTAQGVVDTSARAGKAEQMAVKSGDEAASKATANFKSTIEHLYEQRDKKFSSTGDVLSFADGVAKKVNAGITKEGVLLRDSDSAKFAYTPVDQLPAARKQFAQEFRQRLDSDDPVETAAWIHYRVNFTDHFYADGVGKTSEALASYVLMRHDHPLPEIKSRKDWFAHAPKVQIDPAKSGWGAYVASPEYANWVSYYRSLFPKEATAKSLTVRKTGDDCGTGAGGFKPGNTCGKGDGSGKESEPKGDSRTRAKDDKATKPQSSLGEAPTLDTKTNNDVYDRIPINLESSPGIQEAAAKVGMKVIPPELAHSLHNVEKPAWHFPTNTGIILKVRNMTEISGRMKGIPEEKVAAFSKEFLGKRADDYANYSPHEKAAAQLQDLWATTSADTDKWAQAVQQLAAEKFGLKDTFDPMPTTVTHGVAQGDYQPIRPNASAVEFKRSTQDVVERHKDVINGFLQATYDNTQERLKAAGVESMMLYRGMGGEELDIGEEPRNEKGTAYVEKQVMKLQPLSSFSTSFADAWDFASSNSQKNAVVMAVHVPREKIFSTALSGPGCANEHEVVLLGGKMMSRAMVASTSYQDEEYSRVKVHPTEDEFWKAKGVDRSDPRFHPKSLRKSGCGTGAGGFQPGNTCSKESGGGSSEGKESGKPEGKERENFSALLSKIAKPDGGFSYQPITEEVPKTGYALSPYPERSFAVNVNDLKITDLWDYVQKNGDLLAEQKHYFGAWHDPGTGKVFLDVSVVVQDENEAAELARAKDQIAYFDLVKGASVTVNRQATSGGQVKAEETQYATAKSYPTRTIRGTIDVVNKHWGKALKTLRKAKWPRST